MTAVLISVIFCIMHRELKGIFDSDIPCVLEGTPCVLTARHLWRSRELKAVNRPWGFSVSHRSRTWASMTPCFRKARELRYMNGSLMTWMVTLGSSILVRYERGLHLNEMGLVLNVHLLTAQAFTVGSDDSSCILNYFLVILSVGF